MTTAPKPTDNAAEEVVTGEAEAAVEADLDSLNDDVRRERDEYLELAQRARADFENYRKRAAAEASDAERRGKAGIARELVPVIDNLERALDAAAEDDPLRQGVELVHRDLVSVLKRAGVESYDPTGEPFDPSLHEALATRPADDTKSGTVIETVERGYRLDGQLIRPARVVVAE
jgi:molecular chaperone GrpE